MLYLIPHFLYLYWISLQKKKFKEFYWIWLRCWNRCCKDVWSQSSGQQNWVTIFLFHPLYTSSPRTDIVYTWYCPRLLNTPRPTYCRRGKVLWLVVVKRSIKQERYKSKAEHISYIYILATDWRRPHCCSALIDDCWPSKETFFEMLACNYDERTVKKWWLFQIWQWSGQHRLC